MSARAGDPFAALGLDRGAGLTDDDVRAAWRRVASATHPDRADGGDPERFAVAAAAYTELRTAFGRGEARARHAGQVPAAAAGVRETKGPRLPAAAAAIRAMITRGRPLRLALRVVAAAAAAALGFVAAGRGPAGPALATGAATWLVLTVRQDLGMRAASGRQPAMPTRPPPRPDQPGSAPVATGRPWSADHADQDPT